MGKLGWSVQLKSFVLRRGQAGQCKRKKGKVPDEGAPDRHRKCFHETETAPLVQINTFPKKDVRRILPVTRGEVILKKG